MDAIITVVAPEEMVCWATAVMPMPPTSRKAPTSMQLRNWRGLTRSRWRSSTIGVSSRAAARKREPIIRKGGRSVSAKRIARYVVPQTT